MRVALLPVEKLDIGVSPVGERDRAALALGKEVGVQLRGAHDDEHVIAEQYLEAAA